MHPTSSTIFINTPFYFVMNLGNSIKAFRKERKLSQSDLAGMCGITSTYLSLVENGKKEPTIALIKIIAEKLEVPLPILIFSAITDEDIPIEKKELFELVKPSVDSILQKLISEDAVSEG